MALSKLEEFDIYGDPVNSLWDMLYSLTKAKHGESVIFISNADKYRREILKHFVLNVVNYSYTEIVHDGVISVVITKGVNV